MAKQSRTLKPCPCGETPAALEITGASQSPNWAAVSSASCCGEWSVEYRNGWLDIGSDEAYQLAVEAWNRAPRPLQAVREKQGE